MIPPRSPGRPLPGRRPRRAIAVVVAGALLSGAGCFPPRVDLGGHLADLVDAFPPPPGWTLEDPVPAGGGDCPYSCPSVDQVATPPTTPATYDPAQLCDQVERRIEDNSAYRSLMNDTDLDTYQCFLSFRDTDLSVGYTIRVEKGEPRVSYSVGQSG